MERIRLKNYKGFIDTGDIEIKPLNILVGTNSSGKSSFLRFFPLMKQSCSNLTHGALAFFGEFVDLGEFNDVKSTLTKDEYIEIDFDIKAQFAHFVFSSEKNYNSELVYNINARIEKNESNLIYTSKLTIKFLGHTLIININKNLKVTSIVVNGEKIVDDVNKIELIFNSSIIPQMMYKQITIDETIFIRDFNISLFANPLKNVINQFYEQKNKKDINYGKIKEALLSIFCECNFNLTKGQNLNDINTSGEIKNLLTKYLNNVDDIELKELNNILLLNYLPYLLDMVSIYIKRGARKIAYSAPLRAITGRYNRRQDLSVNEISSTGDNLLALIESLSASKKENFNKWLLENFDFCLLTETIPGHTILIIKEGSTNNGTGYNIADMGFGYTQILPIIIQLWYIQSGVSPMTRSVENLTPIIYAIEQPELHLHPAFLKKLLNVIAKVSNNSNSNNSNKIKIKFIIETHSEKLINYLGELIENKIINNKAINILCFNKNRETQEVNIQKSKFDSDGVLENWPIGFFDI